MKTRIAIVDDHEMVLKGFASMIREMEGVEVVGLYANATETLEKIVEDDPDVLFLDINLPDINGIKLSKHLLKLIPALKIIALTNYDEISFVKRMLKNGVQGYMLKNTDQNEIKRALKLVMDDKIYLQPKIEDQLLNSRLKLKTHHMEGIIKLTVREKEVLESIAEELTTQEISEKLFISPKTVESHRMNLMSKLGAKNSVGMVRNAMDVGLL